MRGSGSAAYVSVGGGAGACLSLACAVDCVSMPLLAGLLPVLGFGFLVSEGTETLLVCSALLVACLNLSFGYRVHRRGAVSFLFLIALTLVVAGRSVPEGPVETALVASGALVIACAELLNRRPCRTCGECGGRHGR